MGLHREPVGLTVHIGWSEFQKELGERKSSIKTNIARGTTDPGC